MTAAEQAYLEAGEVTHADGELRRRSRRRDERAEAPAPRDRGRGRGERHRVPRARLHKPLTVGGVEGEGDDARVGPNELVGAAF
jgi:hypothetical protein